MSRARAGVAYGLAAYLWWGFAPLYFKAVATVPPGEVLAHRVVWSTLLLLVLVFTLGRAPAFRAVLADRRTRLALTASMALVAVNWFTFIWAVDHDEVLQASLGYFINPLVNVLLGYLVLKERLRRLQTLSVLLALAGVAYLGVSYGEPPVIALLLAFSFGFYGLIRKRVRAEGMVGLTVETLFLTPVALAYLAWLAHAGRLTFGHAGSGLTLLLAASGVVTALPLLWFANAARRLRYATVGFLQYLAPSFQFLLAVAVFGEPFTRAHAVAFPLIWAALAIYSLDALRAARLSRLA